MKMAARVNKDPNFLWVRVLKGLYHRCGDFSTASKGAWASWGWASILHGWDILIREGLWIVEDGKSINVQTDPWIYTKNKWRMEITTKEEQPLPMKVAELLNPDRTWNEQKVQSAADPTDASCILQIPIPVEVEPDELIGPFMEDECATTKSISYRLRAAKEGNPADLTKRGDRTTTIWRHIWATNTTPKIKNFVWKMLTNSLFVRMNLVHRQMNVSPCCLMCGMNEDTEHMIYRCRWTDAVWFGTLGLTEGHKGRNTIGNWIMDRRNEPAANHAVKEERWQLCLWTCWIILKKRFIAVVEQAMPNPGLLSTRQRS